MSSHVLDRAAASPTDGGVAAIRTRAFTLPEVRWAAVATVLFALGRGRRSSAVPRPGCGGRRTWRCYAAGGWEPAWPGCGRCGTRHSMSTC